MTVRTRGGRHRLPHTFLAVAFALGSLPACHPREKLAAFDGPAIGVADGDTITVLLRGAQVRVRLNGIDCPERGQPFSARAKQFTSELVFGRTVTVRPLSTDRYRRVVADVVLPDGRVLNRELVAAGLAWHYTKYSKDEDLARLERKAREARLGIWSEGRTVAPWEHRAAGRAAGR